MNRDDEVVWPVELHRHPPPSRAVAVGPCADGGVGPGSVLLKDDRHVDVLLALVAVRHPQEAECLADGRVPAAATLVLPLLRVSLALEGPVKPVEHFRHGPGAVPREEEVRLPELVRMMVPANGGPGLNRYRAALQIEHVFS